MSPAQRSKHPRLLVIWLAVSTVAIVGVSCSLGPDDDAGDGGASTTATPSTTLVPSGLLSPIDKVLPGQCFDQLPDTAQRPFAVLAIPCEQPHHYEIFDRFTYRAGDGKAVPKGFPYPGVTPVRQQAEAGCFEKFQPWMGIDWTRSDFDIQSWFPSSASWAKFDRTVTCAVFRFDGVSTSGSVRGAKT